MRPKATSNCDVCRNTVDLQDELPHRTCGISDTPWMHGSAEPVFYEWPRATFWVRVAWLLSLANVKHPSSLAGCVGGEGEHAHDTRGTRATIVNRHVM